MQQRQQVFSHLALSAANAFTLTGRGDPEQVIGLHASAALLPALGPEPLVWRNFSADEDRRGGERTALISHAVWQQRLNGDPSVLGQTLTIDGAPYHHRRVAGDGNGVPLGSAADLGVPAGGGDLSRGVAVEQRRLLVSGHRTA